MEKYDKGMFWGGILLGVAIGLGIAMLIFIWGL